ncbi:MAG: phage/plasmid replication protein, II/X family, partial [Candidatus Gottesmanbacteria bacterium]|nr:phage/plasmid replication protein, II/X family [Candidatus Gottesmanbacteria bacterium]
MANEIMVDWVTASVVSENARNRVSAEFDTGSIYKVNREGEIEQRFSSREMLIGSFDSSLSFRAPYPWQLEMSGNPAKFLQGHNLFGSDDSLNLFFSAGMVSRFNFNSPFPVPS